MEVVNALKICAWITAILGGGFVLFRQYKTNATIDLRRLYWPVIAALSMFTMMYLVAIGYVASRMTDPMWITGAEPQISSPQLPDGPIIGQVTGQIQPFLDDIAGSINTTVGSARSLEVSVQVIQDLLITTGFALVILAPLIVLAIVVDRVERLMLVRTAKKQDKRIKRLETAIFGESSVEVD